MELDHVFVFVDSGESPMLASLRSIGLTETYRRKHLGQGTENICFCFENLFLELLWVSDVSAVTSDRIAKTRLFERSSWKVQGTNPFGIAWRGTAHNAASQPQTWDYRPPYLPSGVSIAVAHDSDDLVQPMMFQSPGTSSPKEWPLERQGQLQGPARLLRVLNTTLELPRAVASSVALRAIAKETRLQLVVSRTEEFALSMQIEHMDGPEPATLTLRPRSQSVSLVRGT
jgi:Glyoxalase-like domain